MQYDLLRLVLVRREQPDMLERRGRQGEALTREGWLRSVFSEDIEFVHYKNDFM
jgi:hypothetical protein